MSRLLRCCLLALGIAGWVAPAAAQDDEDRHPGDIPLEDLLRLPEPRPAHAPRSAARPGTDPGLLQLLPDAPGPAAREVVTPWPADTAGPRGQRPAAATAPVDARMRRASEGARPYQLRSDGPEPGRAVAPPLPPTHDRTPAALVREAVERLRLRLKLCYDSALAQAPGLHGDMRLRLEFAADGQVRHAELTVDGVGQEALRDCIVDAAGRLQTVAPLGAPLVVELPLELRLRQEVR